VLIVNPSEKPPCSCARRLRCLICIDGGAGESARRRGRCSWLAAHASQAADVMCCVTQSATRHRSPADRRESAGTHQQWSSILVLARPLFGHGCSSDQARGATRRCMRWSGVRRRPHPTKSVADAASGSVPLLKRRFHGGRAPAGGSAPRIRSLPLWPLDDGMQLRKMRRSTDVRANRKPKKASENSEGAAHRSEQLIGASRYLRDRIRSYVAGWNALPHLREKRSELT